jgi:hypothetical protein
VETASSSASALVATSLSNNGFLSMPSARAVEHCREPSSDLVERGPAGQLGFSCLQERQAIMLRLQLFYQRVESDHRGVAPRLFLSCNGILAQACSIPEGSGRRAGTRDLCAPCACRATRDGDGKTVPVVWIITHALTGDSGQIAAKRCRYRDRFRGGGDTLLSYPRTCASQADRRASSYWPWRNKALRRQPVRMTRSGSGVAVSSKSARRRQCGIPTPSRPYCRPIACTSRKTGLHEYSWDLGMFSACRYHHACFRRAGPMPLGGCALLSIPEC